MTTEVNNKSKISVKTYVTLTASIIRVIASMTEGFDVQQKILLLQSKLHR